MSKSLYYAALDISKKMGRHIFRPSTRNKASKTRKPKSLTKPALRVRTWGK